MGKEKECGHYEAERNTLFGVAHKAAHDVFGKPNTRQGRVVDGVLAASTVGLLGTAILNRKSLGLIAKVIIGVDVASQGLMHASQVVRQCEYSESPLGEDGGEEEIA
jgi:hypothetical protein